METDVRIAMKPVCRSKIDELKRQRAVKLASKQKIHARIRASSKYFGQTDAGELFPVFIDAGARDAYKVLGGPGGQYRLSDVDLFVVDETGAALQIG